jgi:membrane-associated phospholipid phosphatase
LGAAFCHTLAEHLCESRVVCGIYYPSDIVAGEVVATAVVVTYAYKIVNLASCAETPDVQQAFPDIGAIVGGRRKRIRQQDFS